MCFDTAASSNSDAAVTLAAQEWAYRGMQEVQYGDSPKGITINRLTTDVFGFIPVPPHLEHVYIELGFMIGGG